MAHRGGQITRELVPSPDTDPVRRRSTVSIVTCTPMNSRPKCRLHPVAPWTVASEFILIGAGFSRAISPRMPLLQDLASEVLPELEVDASALQPFGGNFEQWMSHLASEQPWLTEPENLRNRALFIQASDAVHKSVVAREAEATSTPPPEWLLRLLLHWTHHQSVICSFNYDLLIERCLSSLYLVKAWSDLYGVALEARMPPGSSRSVSTNMPPGPIPTLLKLHGSTSWSYGGPSAPVSDRITLGQSGLRWNTPFGVPPASGRYSALHDGLVPLIVPPATTKSAYYGNLSLRAQWRRAYLALRSATSLTVIGYSFPPGDLQARHFVAQAAADGLPVTVVDARAEAGDDLSSLLGRAGDIQRFFGDSAVQDYVAASCSQILRWGVAGGEHPRPVLTLDGVDQVPSDWAPPVPSASDVASAARAWLHDTLAARWPRRTNEQYDYWTQQDGSFAGGLQMAYVLP